MLQLSSSSIQFLLVVFPLIGVYALFLIYYWYKGSNQQLEIAKGERSTPEGFGAWYARNITGFAKSVAFSSIALTGPYAIYLTVSFLMFPSQFGTIVKSTWGDFSFFTLYGFVMGFIIWDRIRAVREFADCPG